MVDPVEAQNKDFPAWIVEARAGSREAANHICRALESRVRAHITRQLDARLRRWVEPEDILQQALQENARAFDRLSEDASREDVLRNMLHTANLRLKDAYRRHRRSAGESVLEIPPAELLAELPSNGTVTREDRTRWLLALVARLPAKYGQVVRLCALEELSYVEAGQRLGLQPDTVRKRFETARETLMREAARRRDA